MDASRAFAYIKQHRECNVCDAVKLTLLHLLVFQASF